MAFKARKHNDLRVAGRPIMIISNARFLPPPTSHISYFWRYYSAFARFARTALAHDFNNLVRHLHSTQPSPPLIFSQRLIARHSPPNPSSMFDIGGKCPGQYTDTLLSHHLHACGKRSWSLNSAGISFPSWRHQAADEYNLQTDSSWNALWYNLPEMFCISLETQRFQICHELL
jgi:hypothetical protein